MPQTSQEFNRVAKCLHRKGNRHSCTIVKVSGKLIGRSLKTNAIAIARQRPVELRAMLSRNCS